MKVDAVLLEARRLLTIGPGDALWDNGIAEYGDMAGAIVRIQPPAEADDAAVETVRAQCMRNGAAVVRVDQRTRGDQTPLAFLPTVTNRNAANRKPHAQRATVMTLAAKSPQAAELVPLLDAVLAKVKL